MHRISTAFMAIVCALSALLASGVRDALEIMAGEPVPGGAMALGVLAAAILGAAASRLLPRAEERLPVQDAPPPPAAALRPGPDPRDMLAAKERLLADAASQPAALASDMGRAISSAMARAEAASRACSDWAAPMRHCRELLDGCAASLEALRLAMDRVRAQASRASSKLSVISDTAAEAQSLVAGMSSIAEQTDMLSVNASIEAEKAGEHGRGFAVVAREVRRLADTAQSGAQDVERLVARMRQAVASEVMEMDSFTREAAGGDSRLEELALTVREASRALAGAAASLEEFAARTGQMPAALDLAMTMARDLEASLAELGELAASGGGLASGQQTEKDGSR